ncbi:MAG TPA: YncE family protein [Candidatus Angelobacter sp.]|jgi:YVTN family beta-propeller protein
MKRALLSLASLLLSISLLSLQLRADSVLTTINIGSGSTAIAANARTNKLYVAAGQVVAVIDGKTQQVTAKINIAGGGVNFVAVDILTDRIYASSCNAGTCNIVVINGNTNHVIANIPIASGSQIGIQGLAVNPVTGRIYASDADNGLLLMIDGKTNTIIDQIVVSSQPGGISVNPQTDRIYIAGSGFPGLIMVYDGATDALIANIPEDFGVANTAVNFVLNRAYATNQDKVIVVDGATNQEITRVPAGPFANGVDVNLLNNKIYVTNSSGGSVTIINGNTNQVLQTLPVPAVFPDGVAVDLANGLTYVTDVDSNNVIVLKP